MTRSELPFFVKIMRDYHSHMTTLPDSLLSRFFGLYRMKLPGKRAMTVVVMQNLFYTNLEVHLKYDLKGSTVKRFVTQKEQDAGTSVLKDLNFRSKISLDAATKARFVSTLRSDAHFLRESNIMDYSLLLGINTDPNSEKSKRNRSASTCLPPLPNPTFWQQRDGGVPAASGKETYFLGVIDILQKVRARFLVLVCSCYLL